jgi:predicted ATPase/class 3 adenylate cyclase
LVAELPSGTVTFLFTDLESSTRLWEQFPDAMKEALARHDEILRDAIAAHDGYVVKMTGDGVHAAFGTAQSAIGAAVDAQRALTAEEWPVVEVLRIRMGLHTGAAESRDGDYFGTAVNKAARLMSAAHGGQILASLATEEVARDALEDEVELLDLGEHRLRDLSRAERVYQVCAPGLTTEFSPLRSLDALPSNLPRQLTSFVGRDDALVEIGKAVSQSHLVTLTGVGGVGKTRLALQVAAERLPHFGNGVWLCELAVCADPATMAQVVAVSIGAVQRAGITLEESIVEYARTRDMLIVLDNCEHLLDAVALLTERLLRECPGVRILATSREALGIGGEQAWPVRSLSLPDASSRESAQRSDAVQLFVERATAVKPTFMLDDEGARAVVEICRRLDGVPLAIELAAARVVAMSPAQITSLLDERFRLLVGGRRTAVERHQTLRATVEWSYALLDATERAVFDRLGVFPGSFDSDAAVAVATGDGVESWDVLDSLTSLTAKSMIGTDDGPDGTIRHQMLETLRQYAREQLDRDGEPDPARRRHADHYAGRAETVGPQLMGPGEFTWRPRFYADLDNFRTAVFWALDRDSVDDVEIGLRIIAGLGEQASQDPGCGVGAWAERASAQAEHSTPGRRTTILGGAAWSAYRRGDAFGAGAAYARAALRDGLPHDCPAPATPLMAHAMWGRDLLDALDWIEAASAELDVQPYVRTHLFAVAAFIAETITDLDRGRVPAEAAVANARLVGNPTGLAVAFGTFGRVSRYHDPAAARSALEDSVALTHSGAGTGVYGLALGALAELCAATGDIGDALHVLREGVRFTVDVGDDPMLLLILDHGIRVLRAVDGVLAATLHGYVTTPAAASIQFVPVGNAPLGILDSIRARVGDDTYTSATLRGASMTLSDLSKLTLARLDQLLAEYEA